MMVWSQKGNRGGCMMPPASARTLHRAGDTCAAEWLWHWSSPWQERGTHASIPRVTTVVLLALTLSSQFRSSG